MPPAQNAGKPQERVNVGQPKSRSRLIWTLAVLVILLASCNIFMIVQSGLARQVAGKLWTSLTNAEGIRILLSQLDLGAPPREAALQWTQRGAELLEKGAPREAVKAFQEAIDLAPNQVTAYLGLASAYEGLDDREQEIELLERASELDPYNADAHRHLGRLRCLTGECVACVEALERSVELEPDNAFGHFFLAMGAYQGDAEDGYSKAEEAYREVLRQDPEFGGAHLGLGYLYKNRPGKEALALEQFKRALDVAVEVGDESLAAQARSELADLYFAEDNYSKCIDELRQVLSVNPDSADAHRRIGLCYALRGGAGDLEKAISELDRALALDFAYVDLYYLYLGEHLAAQGEGQALLRRGSNSCASAMMWT